MSAAEARGAALVAFVHEQLNEDERRAHEGEHPERVLRQVAADRRIVAEYERLLFRDPLRGGPYWGGQREAWEMAVRMRAEVYDDRPGYQERWRPCTTS